MSDLNAIRKAVSSIPISNAKRNIIIKAFSEGVGVSPEEFASVKDDVKTLIDTALTKSNLGKANGIASLDSTGNVPKSQLGNVDVDLFYVVTELPTTNIKTNKIYLKKSTETGEENIYTEYAYINNSWEKMGEFKANPDLSGYMKKSGGQFTGMIWTNYGSHAGMLGNGGWVAMESARSNKNYIWAGDGSLISTGTSETFTFTLDDGSTVTKNIRVLSR